MRKSLMSVLITVLILGSGMIIFEGSIAENEKEDNTLVSQTRSNTITVDINGAGMYTKIQDAINASSDGDTILVYPGTYNETLRINKSVKIDKYSEEKPIFVGRNYSQTYITEIKINANHVEISNFSFIGFSDGIHFADSNNSIIQYCNFQFCTATVTFTNNYYPICRYNKFESCMYSIGTGNSIDVDIHDIVITNCYNGITAIGWYGENRCNIDNIIMDNITRCFRFEGENYLNISNIKVSDSDYIHYFLDLFEGGNIVFDNLSANNMLMGMGFNMENKEGSPNRLTVKNSILENVSIASIFFNDCESTRVVDNVTIKNCGGGIYSERSTGGAYISNITCYNVDNATYIKGNEKTILKNNKIYGSKNNGIAVFGKNVIGLSNIIENCKNGIRLSSTSENNKFYGNDLIDNTNQAIDQGTNNRWYTDYPTGGNYWSDYVGADIKKGYSQDEEGSDGFGDTAYIIDDGIYDLYPIYVDREDPVAVAPNDISFDEGTVYHFDSSASTDDQLIHRAVWKFDYDGEPTEIDNLEFDFLFDIPGIYNVEMIVFDYYGNSDFDTMTVTVDDIYNPIAVSQGDLEISKDTNVIFNGTGSHDSSGIKEYHWTFDFHGDDIHLTGPTPGFTFTRTGIFQVTLKVIDNYDHFGETIFNVSVPDVDRPVVDAGDDITVDNGDTVDLDGSGTTDDSGIANYTWSFRYNNNLTFIDGMVQSFLFEIPGVYVVTLTVTDVFGNSGSDSITITVRDTIPPVAMIVGSHTLLDGEICNLDGTKSTDNGKIVKYVWTFTDDKTYNFEEEKMLYDFKVKGYHNISLTVWDEFNLSDSTWVILEVVDTTTPVANAGQDQTIGAGQTIIFNGSASTDDGTIVTWEWNFEYNGEQKELEGETTEFTFNIPGEYTVLLTVFDQSDNYGDDIMLITVTGPVDDDDDDIKDNDTREKENEFPILLVIIPLVIVVVLIIGIVVFLFMKKKKPKEDQPTNKEERSPEDAVDEAFDELYKEEYGEEALDELHESLSEDLSENEASIFDGYDLPVQDETPPVEEPAPELFTDPTDEISGEREEDNPPEIKDSEYFENGI